MKKVWSIQHAGNTIVVTNEWSWNGDTTESIMINDEVIQTRSYNVTDVSVTRALGTIFIIAYGSHTYRIVCGSAWHLCGMACRVEVDGKRVGGNRIVLFAKESA
ncbi:MAG: hypothetical protein RLZZ70_200 [Candidatus Parcubacteria bacterium]|jgi:hypothetical protein